MRNMTGKNDRHSITIRRCRKRTTDVVRKLQTRTTDPSKKHLLACPLNEFLCCTDDPHLPLPHNIKKRLAYPASCTSETIRAGNNGILQHVSCYCVVIAPVTVLSHLSNTSTDSR